MTDKPFVTRRNFFQKVFKRKENGECMIALQVVFDTGPRQEIYDELRAIMGDYGAADVDELRRYYKRLVRVLLEAQFAFEYASFEYIDTADETEDTFDEWVTEIEDAIAAEEHDPYDPFVVERYVAVTVAFLLDHAHPLSGREMSEEWLYTREGLVALLEAIPRFEWQGVIGHAAFVLPADESAGMTRDDLEDDGWDYLQPILI